jgi:hypothetical protein
LYVELATSPLGGVGGWYAGEDHQVETGTADGADGQPVPILTVFKRWPDGTIRLHWASELIFAPPEPGQDPRHLGTSRCGRFSI